MEFWSPLSSEQRRDIWGACWAQYPLYSATSFRDFESGKVDFGAISSGSSPERTGFKLYFKTLWLEVADATFMLRVDVRDDAVSASVRSAQVFKLWRSVPTSDAINGLKLGEAEDLPGRLSGTTDTSGN